MLTRMRTCMRTWVCVHNMNVQKNSQFSIYLISISRCNIVRFIVIYGILKNGRNLYIACDVSHSTHPHSFFSRQVWSLSQWPLRPPHWRRIQGDQWISISGWTTGLMNARKHAACYMLCYLLINCGWSFWYILIMVNSLLMKSDGLPWNIVAYTFAFFSVVESCSWHLHHPSSGHPQHCLCFPKLDAPRPLQSGGHLSESSARSPWGVQVCPPGERPQWYQMFLYVSGIRLRMVTCNHCTIEDSWSAGS